MTDAGTPPEEKAPPGRLSERLVHDGRIVRLSVDRVRFPDGSEGDLEMIRHSGASAVVPVFGAPGEANPDILMIRQYRYACDGFIYEIPAGRPDRPGEPWEECAARELEEETGYRAGTLQYLTHIYTTPGFTDEVIHLYAAYDLTPGTHARDVDEFIQIERVPLLEAVDWVRSGRIVDAKTISALLYAFVHLRRDS